MSGVPEEWRLASHFCAGGVAGMVARTVIAPVERVKIIFQTSVSSTGNVAQQPAPTGYTGLISKVIRESGGGMKGVLAFWKGNTVAVVRVFPYLGVQLSANEYFRKVFGCLGPGSLDLLSTEGVYFLAGAGAGMSAVFTTYPLDLARARLALLREQGSSKMPSMVGVMQEVYRQQGFSALYSGAGISMIGAGLYCGIKFSTYDMYKDWCRKHLLPDPEGPPSALHRAVCGGLAGVVAQTFVYPVDVIRRRLQTGGAEAKAKYPGFVSGLLRLYRDEGVARGLYRGLSLNYLKTVPNTTVYLALFDYLKDAIDGK